MEMQNGFLRSRVGMEGNALARHLQAEPAEAFIGAEREIIISIN